MMWRVIQMLCIQLGLLPVYDVLCTPELLTAFQE